MWSLRGPRACPSNLKRTFPRKGIVCGLPKGHIGEHAWESGESWVRWNEHRGGVYISSSRLR